MPLLAEAFRTGTVAYWVERLEARGVPVGAINDYDQTFEDPQVIHRGLRLDLPRDDGATFSTIASPLRLSVTPPVVPTAPPTLGGSTDEVLAELTNLTLEEVRALKAKRVLA